MSLRAACVSALVLGSVLAAPGAAAQSLRERIDAAPAGAVRISYPAREGVCGRGSAYAGERGDRNWRPGCAREPVRVQLDRQGGRVTGVHVYVGGAWLPGSSAVDLGDVSADEASALFFDLVPDSPTPVARKALTAAVLADAPDPWRRLLTLARDPSLGREVRKQAVFWLGQSAADEATSALAGFAADAADTEVQKSAVFALSRNETPERIEHLVRIARTHRNPEVVRNALFWLAQSDDDRAVQLFADILGGAADRP